MAYTRMIPTLGVLFLLAACQPHAQPIVSPKSGAPVPVGSSSANSIANLSTISTVASTVASNGDKCPMGLAVVPATDSTAVVRGGNVLVADFMDASGVAGKGRSVVQIDPAQASPSAQVVWAGARGAMAVTVSGTIQPWIADFDLASQASGSGDVQVVLPNGNLAPGGDINNQTATSSLFAGPWGELFVAYKPQGAAAATPFFYTTNALNGTVVRIQGHPGNFAAGTLASIATGLGTKNPSDPANVQGPQGMAYDAALDTLYVSDTANNRIVAISGVSTETAPASFTATGASASNARVVFTGAPLNAPQGLALNADGNLVSVNGVGPNLVNEITPAGGLVASRNVGGVDGSLFGLAIAGASGSQVVYFTDTNANALKKLSR